MSSYLATFYKAGLIAEDYQVYRTEKEIKAVLVTAGPDALNKEYQSIYVREDEAVVKQNFNVNPTVIGWSNDYTE